MDKTKDADVLKIKRITDISDELSKKDRMRELLSTIKNSVSQFEDAYRTRRERLLELNAIYRNKSYLDKNKAGWQSSMDLPLPYNAVERKTSVIHQAVWADRISAPFSAVGRTQEDHEYAQSAEGLLNNTMDRIGFYKTSERGIRSTCKYGLGVYRYGWTRRTDEYLWRETEMDDKGNVVRDGLGRPKYKFVRKKMRVNQPYVRSVDIVDHLGWDPKAKSFSKWGCGYLFEIEDTTSEQIYELELKGEYAKGSFKSLGERDPHGLSGLELLDKKETQMRQDEGVTDAPIQGPSGDVHPIHWFGWFDIDGDGVKEFIKAVVVLDNDQILLAEENLLGEYPFVDVPYSQSLHSMTSWGVIDPVVEVWYQINEFFNQRNDSIKLKLHPQFLIDVDKVLEDHAYVSSPGAFHPFSGLEDKSVSNAMQVLQFQNMEFLGVNEEERLLNVWSEVTGVADFQKILNTSNKNTPASTIISILNEQQAGNSMIINGVLERLGELGSRILKLIQLFGDEEFVLRTAGRRGLEFRKESLENILGDYDIKVSTNAFFGNKETEIQQAIQLRPLWQDAPHINIEEVDRAVVEGIFPKRVDKIMNVPIKPLTVFEEQALFLAGQGESVTLSEEEDPASLEAKLSEHNAFKRSSAFKSLDPVDVLEFDKHVRRIEQRLELIAQQQQIAAQEAAKAQAQGNPADPGGNINNNGSPNIRTLRNVARPNVPASR